MASRRLPDRPPTTSPVHTPDWVKDAIFYQIFPDRFARSDRIKHPPGLRFLAWGAPPEQQGFQGGDLYGIVDRLDYIAELGATALYLNPVFASASNHRYHTYDYYQVDPLLGGNDALRELVDAAHARGIRVILDGVFNHTGRGFWPFHHLLECGADSPYLDWFTVKGWPLAPYPRNPQEKLNYDAWWNLPALPKLNTDSPAVREYLFDVARHWIEQGIDGWRLDVPSEIDDDDFWRTFRTVVKSANPEAYICGEIWHEARRWLEGDQFDAVMNYLFTSPTISFFAAKTVRTEYRPPHLHFAPIDAQQLAAQIDQMYGLYDWEINFAQMNMLDSHDMARAAWIARDKTAMRLCVLFQMTMPGAPCIYYGDEIGLSAGGDPHCRAAFPWHDEAAWDRELLAFYRQATALRHAHPVLRTGSFETLFAEGEIYAFRRRLGESDAIVVFNASTSPLQQQFHFDNRPNGRFQQVWPPISDQTHSLTDGVIEISIPPREALVLVRHDAQ
jgi:neopullulanase